MANGGSDNTLGTIFDFIFSHNKPGQGLKPRKPVKATGNEVADGLTEVALRPAVYASSEVNKLYDNTLGDTTILQFYVDIKDPDNTSRVRIKLKDIGGFVNNPTAVADSVLDALEKGRNVGRMGLAKNVGKYAFAVGAAAVWAKRSGATAQEAVDYGLATASKGGIHLVPKIRAYMTDYVLEDAFDARLNPTDPNSHTFRSKLVGLSNKESAKLKKEIINDIISTHLDIGKKESELLDEIKTKLARRLAGRFSNDEIEQFAKEIRARYKVEASNLGLTPFKMKEFQFQSVAAKTYSRAYERYLEAQLRRATDPSERARLQKLLTGLEVVRQYKVYSKSARNFIRELDAKLQDIDKMLQNPDYASYHQRLQQIKTEYQRMFRDEHQKVFGYKAKDYHLSKDEVSFLDSHESRYTEDDDHYEKSAKFRYVQTRIKRDIELLEIQKRQQYAKVEGELRSQIQRETDLRRRQLLQSQLSALQRERNEILADIRTLHKRTKYLTFNMIGAKIGQAQMFYSAYKDMVARGGLASMALGGLAYFALPVSPGVMAPSSEFGGIILDGDVKSGIKLHHVKGKDGSLQPAYINSIVSVYVRPRSGASPIYAQLANLYYFTPGSIMKTLFWTGEGFYYLHHRRVRFLESMMKKQLLGRGQGSFTQGFAKLLATEVFSNEDYKKLFLDAFGGEGGLFKENEEFMNLFKKLSSSSNPADLEKLAKLLADSKPTLVLDLFNQLLAKDADLYKKIYSNSQYRKILDLVGKYSKSFNKIRNAISLRWAQFLNNKNIPFTPSWIQQMAKKYLPVLNKDGWFSKKLYGLLQGVSSKEIYQSNLLAFVNGETGLRQFLRSLMVALTEKLFAALNISASAATGGVGVLLTGLSFIAERIVVAVSKPIVRISMWLIYGMLAFIVFVIWAGLGNWKYLSPTRYIVPGLCLDCVFNDSNPYSVIAGDTVPPVSSGDGSTGPGGSGGSGGGPVVVQPPAGLVKSSKCWLGVSSALCRQGWDPGSPIGVSTHSYRKSNVFRGESKPMDLAFSSTLFAPPNCQKGGCRARVLLITSYFTYRKNPPYAGDVVILTDKKGFSYVLVHVISYVRNGQVVKSGPVAKIGTRADGIVPSGAWSGPHLHFEMYKNGVAIDPITALEQQGCSITGADQCVRPEMRE